MGLGHSVLGDNTRTRLMTSVSKDSPWKSPGGRAYVEDNRRLGLWHMKIQDDPGRVQGEGLC